MVSVIVPNFNHSRFLEQRIDSILNQTYQDFELIILDDHSTDNSKEIIEKYRTHPKVSHIEYNQLNTGSPFKQWQKGISLSKGDFVWIAESDDWADPDFLKETYITIQKDNEIGLIYSDSNLYIDGKLIKTLSKEKKEILKNSKWDMSYIHNGDFEIEDSLALCCSVNNASSVLFNREILLQAAPFDIDFKYLGDWYCYLKIASISKIAYINKPLNHYRDHTDNISKKGQSSFTQLVEYFQIYNWIFKYVTKMNEIKVLSFFDGFTASSFSLLDLALIKKSKPLYNLNKKLFLHMIKFIIKSKILSVLKDLKKNLFKFK